MHRPAPPASLRALAAAVDLYKHVFVAGPAAPLLSRPKPLRRHGFDMTLVVDAMTTEAEDVRGLTLRATDGGRLPSWTPGSHLDVFLPSGRQRQYSLCGDPADPFNYRIAVRRLADGNGGSVEVHDVLHAGDPIHVRGPRNAFTFVDAPSYLFIAAGIGITPILPMAKAAGTRGRLIYLGRSRASMPFLDEVPGHADIRPDDEAGTPRIAELLAQAAPGAAVYVCGPPPVLASAHRDFFGLNPTGSLHTERFSALPVADGKAFELTLARTGTTVRVGAEETALAAIRRAVPDVVYSCQQGFCGTCRVGVLDGQVDHRDRALTPAERGDQMLTCVSRAAGDTLLIDL
ncbi:oxidoreductase [Nocardia cyriacigeorgica]|uniref:Oxidoreductase n=1 Tax=Nocardia cyriacigeorgica TaxID=135487 RepID=A0ABX0CMY0_9NOCA|nr:PDR/VanB family oxidoreductase [Nocardia cyriacigeorgica]NEW38139.1 oxidoreductase [Nocardia cyriacigeorgica]NEW57534.1 oxidoreductase [Nocardia cyriacigeorgica]